MHVSKVLDKVSRHFRHDLPRGKVAVLAKCVAGAWRGASKHEWDTSKIPPHLQHPLSSLAVQSSSIEAMFLGIG